MKAIRLLVCGFMLATSGVYAADKKPGNTNVPLVKQNQNSQTAKPKNSGYSWQDCVNDMEKEGGHSRQEAYKLCQDMQ